MVCLVCHQITSGALCPRCERTLSPAPERILPTGIRLVGAFEHAGAAKALVHHLKYRGVCRYADMVAERLETLMPSLPLVPIPRALSRKIKYGVDPARVIARALASRLQVPVIEALRPPMHAPRRAGRNHARAVAPFRRRSRLRFPVIVVDDVVTTGATVMSAVTSLGVDMVPTVVAANVVADVSNLGGRQLVQSQEWTQFGKRSHSR